MNKNVNFQVFLNERIQSNLGLKFDLKTNLEIIFQTHIRNIFEI